MLQWLLFCVLLGWFPTATAESCEGRTLASQAEVDSFVNCTSVTGADLIIQGADIDFINLPNLETISFSLRILSCPQLSNVAFDSLTSIGRGRTYIHDGLVISSTGGTASSQGAIYFPSLQTSLGNVYINAARNILTISIPMLRAAGQVTSNGEEVRILSCQELTSIDIGSASTPWITGEVTISSNNALQSVSMDQLTECTKLTIQQGSSQLTLASFSALDTIQSGGLTVSGQSGPSGSGALSLVFTNLTSVGGSVYFTNLQHLEEIKFPNLAEIRGGDLQLGDSSSNKLESLTLVSMPKLTDIDGKLDLTYCGSTSSDPLVLDFESLEHIAADLEISYCQSLAELNFPALAAVDSSVNLDSNNDLSSLNFPVLESLGSSNFYVYGFRVYRSGSTAASPGAVTLSSLRSTVGRIILDQANGLRSLSAPLLAEAGSGFQGNVLYIGGASDLETVDVGSSGQRWVTRGIKVETSPKLQSLRMDQLQAATDVSITGIFPAFVLASFPALETVQGDLSIDGNDGLSPSPLVLDFSNLTTVDGSIAITDLANLETLAMPSLIEVGGTLRIGQPASNRFLPELATISFPKLSLVRGNLLLLRVGENAPTLSLSLPQLAIVRGSLEVERVFQLAVLDLPSLTEIGAGFDVYLCTLLHTVSAPSLARTGLGGSNSGSGGQSCNGCSIRVLDCGMTATEAGAFDLSSLLVVGGLFTVQRSGFQTLDASAVRELGPAYNTEKRVVFIDSNPSLEQVRVASDSAAPFSALGVWVNANPKLRSLHMDALGALDSLQILTVSVDFATASFGSLHSVLNDFKLSGSAGLVVDVLTLNFPQLMTVGGSIEATNLQNLEEFALPSLDQVGASLTLGNNYYNAPILPILSTVFLANLTSVGGNLALYNAGSTSPTAMSVSLDSLVIVRGNLHFDTLSNLEEIDLPVLMRVDQQVNIEDCPALFHFSAPSLVSVGSTFKIKTCGASATGTGSVHMPVLRSTGGTVSFEYASAITSVAMPLLGEIGGTSTSIYVKICPDLEVVNIGSDGPRWAVLDIVLDGNAKLRSLRCETITSARSVAVTLSTPELGLLSFPALESVEQHLTLSGSDGLTSNPLVLDVANLTTVGTYISLSNLRNLEAIEFPSLTSVGGYLTLGSTYSNNLLPQLATVSFPRLASIGGNLGIYNAGSSTQQPMTVDMRQLDMVSGFFALQNVDNLAVLELQALTRVDRNIDIAGCPHLADVSLPRLESTGNNGNSNNYGVRVASCGGSAEDSGMLWMPRLTRTGGRIVVESTGGFRQVSAPLLRETGLGSYGNTIYFRYNVDLEEVYLGSSGEPWTTNQVYLDNCVSLQRVQMDQLTQAGLIQLTSMTSQLQHVSFAALETVALGGGFSVYMTASGGGTQNELVLNFPSLRTTAGQIYLQDTQNLAVVNMPMLERVGERFYVHGCNFLRSVLVPKLEAVGVTLGSSLVFQDSGSESLDVLTLDFPLLGRVSGTILVDNVVNLRELSFPNLTAIDGYLNVEDNGRLASIQMPKATRIGAGTLPTDGVRILRNGGTADEVGVANFEGLTDLAGILLFHSNQNVRALLMPRLNATGEGHTTARETITVTESQDLEEVEIGSQGSAWVTNRIAIKNNPALTSLSMKKLQRCMQLTITGNSRIGPLCFPNLLEIAVWYGASMYLQNNGAMAPACWFFSARNLAVVAGSLTVSGNTKLVLFDMNGLGPEDPGLDDNTACFNCPFEPVKMCPSCILCDAEVEPVRLDCSAAACAVPAPTYVNETLRCTRPPVVGPSCDTDVTWAELLASGEFHAGGLGDLMEEDGFESWMCMAHSCTRAPDLACYKYNEGAHFFEYWDTNSVLGLVTV